MSAMTTSPIPPIWERLGDPPPATLEPTRLWLHWAAQVVAAVPHTHLPAASDDSHTSLAWYQTRSSLVSLPFGRGNWRSGLMLRLGEIALFDGEGSIVASSPIAGKTLAEHYSWMAGCLAKLDSGLSGELSRRDYDMPDHPVAGDAEFPEPDGASLAELCRWFANSAKAFGQWTSRPHVSPVRIWPHHFDSAILIKEAPDGSRTIGVGMSPGDQKFPEPYWYVTPWPSPESPPSEHLPSGFWHDEGWIGAVLPAETIVAEPASAAQAAMVQRFIEESVAALRRQAESEAQ